MEDCASNKKKELILFFWKEADFKTSESDLAWYLHFFLTMLSEYHNCAINIEKDIKCWGYNTDNQVSHHPTPISGNKYDYISCGNKHCCAISTVGAIDCWGRNSDGQVSDIPEGTFYQMTSINNQNCAVSRTLEGNDN